MRRFLTPEELALAGVWLHHDGKLHHHPDIILLHWTGKSTGDRIPLFEQDVVEFDQLTEFGMIRRRGFMKWFENPGHYSIAMDAEAGTPGAQFDTQNVRKIGSMLEDPSLVKQAPQYTP